MGSLSEQERTQYEADLKAYKDTMSCIRFAELKGHDAGVAQGREERDIEIARAMKSKGLDLATISECTNLGIDVIEKL